MSAIGDLQAAVGRWHRATFGEGPHMLGWVGLKLASEAGEACQEILTRIGAPQRDGYVPGDLAAECADVAVCLLAIADRAGFDLADAIAARVEVVTARRYLRQPTLGEAL